MENSAKISVIVPVYNVAPYLTQCIESLCRQTFSKLEIILVDDGSTDESGKICDEFAKKDPRILVIHKKNEGLSSARNAGLSVASGKYIGFVDGDDFVSCEMYQKLYKIAESYESEIVCCQFQTSNGEITEKAEGSETVTVLDTKQAVKKFFLREITESVWDKLFSRRLFDDLFFPEGEINEDTFVVITLILKSRQMIFYDKKLYYYRKRNGSITRSGYSEKFRVVNRHITQIETVIDKCYPDLQAYMKLFFGVHYYYLLLSILTLPDRKKYKNDYEHYLKQFRKTLGSFLHWGTGKQKDKIIAILLVFRLDFLYLHYNDFRRYGEQRWKR